MPFSELGLPVQGSQDEGEVVDEYPVLIAGKDGQTPARIKILLVDTATGALVVSQAAGSPGSVFQGPVTDRSGTITLANTSQQLAAANAARRYLFVDNVGSFPLWINFGVAAVQTQPSIKLEVGASFVMEGTFISNQSVNIIGPTTGQTFTAKEG